MGSELFQTERLKVNYLNYRDLPYFQDMQTNPEVMKFVGAPAMTNKECEVDLQKVISFYDKKNAYFNVWGVYLENEMIGTCAIIQNNEGNEIGYRFRQKFWARGFGKEITKGLLSYAFNKLNVGSVWAEVDISNLASVSILDQFLNRIDKQWNKSDNCWDYKYSLTKQEYENNGH